MKIDKKKLLILILAKVLGIIKLHKTAIGVNKHVIALV